MFLSTENLCEFQKKTTKRKIKLLNKNWGKRTCVKSSINARWKCLEIREMKTNFSKGSKRRVDISYVCLKENQPNIESDMIFCVESIQ